MCSMRNSLFFWVCSIQILLSISSHLALSICLDDQRSLLLQLRTNLDYSHLESRKLATWNQTLDCCQWNGVHCNSSTGHVVGLDLSGESITNSSDSLSSLFSLQFLQSLNLANNRFNNTEIPSGIGRLAGLTYLNLSNAGFGGQVPIEISQLVKLVTVDLSSLSYYGFSPLKLENPSFATLIRGFTKLRGLHLNGVNISSNGSEWCKALSSSVPDLQFLSLSSCKLSGRIDESLENLKSLSEIFLDQNDLVAQVPDFIANFRNLTTIKLSNCKLYGTFPQKILKVLTLRTLDLSFNGLLQGTLPEFPLSSSLQALVVSYTSFSGKLPSSIGNLTVLQRIELVNCSFSGTIPPSMGLLNQLVYVDFSFNKFSGAIPSFSSATNLQFLSLSNNTLTGSLESIDWNSLTKLLTLDLSVNSLNGSIPMSLFSLSSLQTLKLSQNRFSGKLRDLPNVSLILTTLDLSSNKLEGPVPKSLFDMKGLKVLDLSYNGFNKSLNLNKIQQLKNLSSLELSHNSLSVTSSSISANGSLFPQLSSLGLGSCNLHDLPHFLRNQSKIDYLDLSDNNIGGAIPKWIWRVGNGSLSSLNLACNNFTDLERPLPAAPSLKFLDISSNRINGEVPTLASISPEFLDYSNNHFTSISPDIGNSLLYTIYLSISWNNISQEIPMTLCKANLLQVLDLSSNLLNGTIPDCILNMTLTLRVLNLRGNHLRGNITNIFPEGCRLRTIDVGCNFLQGQIPQSLVNCEQLQVLDVRSNQLQDTFPFWLRNLSNLQILVMRENKFYGSVCSQSNLAWPKLQLIDIATNYFDGEIKSQCISNMSALMGRSDNPRMDITGIRYPVLVLDNIYYRDTVVVTFKSREYKLQKVLTLFTCLDFSSNRFQGDIPEAVGNLNALIVLNLSHNAFSGTIPPSIGNLSMLESLDLSYNRLRGSIPKQLANIYTLEYLNLSFNELVGQIPTGNQLQTFDATSYAGNMGLYGPPLSPILPAPSKVQDRKSTAKAGFDWQYILIGSGFGTGAALVVAPLLFWKKGWSWLNKRVDKLVSVILLACRIDHATLDDKVPQLDEGTGPQLFDITSNREVQTEDEDGSIRFCVFCSKLDIDMKRVIHNPRCTCHSLLSHSLSFSLSSSQ